jgi:nitroimidazol reductase NimA-like FMN-containing flavoprotein (pyridoxamine 5'-phosphate oxidase superfamily)
MGKFTPEEIAYLQSQRSGSLATVSQDGELHVVPVTFRYHPEHEQGFSQTRERTHLDGKNSVW